VGDTGTILKSTDAGRTWTPLTSGTSTTLHGIYFLIPMKEWLLATMARFFVRLMAGLPGQSIASGVGDSLRSVSFNGENGICGGDSPNYSLLDRFRASWQIGQSGFLAALPGAQMLNTTTGFVAGQNSIFQPLVGKTTDGGVIGVFRTSISTATKAAAMTCSFSIKPH